MESRLQPVVRDITDSRARTREEFEGISSLKAAVCHFVNIVCIRTLSKDSFLHSTEVGTGVSF